MRIRIEYVEAMRMVAEIDVDDDQDLDDIDADWLIDEDVLEHGQEIDAAGITEVEVKVL